MLRSAGLARSSSEVEVRAREQVQPGLCTASASFRLRTEHTGIYTDNWRKTNPGPLKVSASCQKRVPRVYEHKTRSCDLFRVLKMLWMKFSFRNLNTRGLGRTTQRTAWESEVRKADKDRVGGGRELMDRSSEPTQLARSDTVQLSHDKGDPRAVLLGLKGECSARTVSLCP